MWFSLDSLGNGSVLKLCAVQTQHYGSCQSDPTVRNRPLAAKLNFLLRINILERIMKIFMLVFSTKVIRIRRY